MRETLGANTLSDEEKAGLKTTGLVLPLLSVGGDTPFMESNLDLDLKESLGIGGMGEVHVANQSPLMREVAIKRSHKQEGDGPSFSSVIREGQQFSRFDHPNIPPIHMLGQDRQGRAVLVMKRISGDDWRSILSDPSHRRWADAGDDRLGWNLNVLIQVCHAVEHAHSRGVVHRDIKTDNIMIGDHGQVYLIDWGVSIDMHEARERTSDNRFIGTPAFAAPEMVIAGKRLGPATDVYLLGGALFEILNGYPPHIGRSVEQVVKRILEFQPLRFVDAVPERLQRICARALSSMIDERFQTVAEFRTEIQKYLSDRHILTQLDDAQALLNEMTNMLHEKKLDVKNAARMMNISFRCRFALEGILEHGVEVELVREKLTDCILTQTRYSILSGEHRLANILLAWAHEHLDVSDPRIIALTDSINTALNGKRQENNPSDLEDHARLIKSMLS